MMHTHKPWLGSALFALSLTVSGCQGVMWGNLAVFAMSVGIFFGTLSLGRGR